MSNEPRNPFLEDDEEDELLLLAQRPALAENPFLTDDVEEEVVPVAPVAPVAPRAFTVPSFVVPAAAAAVPAAVPAADVPEKKKSHLFTGVVSKPENIGKPGYDSLGRKKGHASTRRRLTERDGALLGHLAKYRVAYAEDLAELEWAGVAPGEEESGSPRTTKARTISQRLYRIQKMGYVTGTQDKRGRRVWGTNSEGVAVAQKNGWLTRDGELHPESWKKIGYSYSDHYLMVSRVAAQLVSPVGFFRESLGLEPVSPSSLIPEHELRAAWQAGTEPLRELKKAGKATDFPAFRNGVLRQGLQSVADGSLDWESLLEAHPVLWTVGSYVETGKDKFKQSHFPDLVLSRERGRSAQTSESILFEIELTAKNWAEYKGLLQSFARELATCAVYGRVVYFVPGKRDRTAGEIERLLRKVDKSEGFGLFDSGRFTVLPLYERDGGLIKKKRFIGEKG